MSVLISIFLKSERILLVLCSFSETREAAGKRRPADAPLVSANKTFAAGNFPFLVFFLFFLFISS